MPWGGVVPMNATASKELPPAREDDQFAYEVKWDGVRALAYVRDGAIHMESRNLNDITPRYPEVHGVASALGRSRDAILDGEVVAFDAAGRPSFQVLQHRMHVANVREVERRMVSTPVMYVLFDVLWLDGKSTLSLPYTERRDVLASLQLDGPAWRTGTHQIGGGSALLDAIAAQGLEGIMAKRLTSVYEPGRRSRQWLKLKRQKRQEFVVGGWLPGEGNREGRIGALLVGYHDETSGPDALRFAGKVGTGFTEKTLKELAGLLWPRGRDTSPFVDKVPYKLARFTDPFLVAEVEFTEWTEGGTLRHPSYKGWREDKDPADVVREER
jgi:bifunctional non-homologous end joining protein LigD